MEEFRFLKVTNDPSLPTFVRVQAETRIDAIEMFAQQQRLTIRQITDEMVWFTGSVGRVFYSVSGCDPWLRLLFG